MAWNLHNEEFMKGASSWLRQLKIRGSIGSSGNQNYSTNTSLPVYQYYNSAYYNNFAGAALKNMENPDLGWESKMDYDLGVDFRSTRWTATLDAYISDTRDLVFTRTILPSTGFNSVNDNLGQIRNKGVEASVNYILYQSGSSYFSVYGKIAYNDNRVKKISDALRSYNEKQQKAATESSSTVPVTQYYDDMPLNSIWAVRSLGIDPVSGKEIYLDKDGNVTNVWNAGDLVNCGSSDPKYNGNFGFTGEIKGVGMNMVLTYYGGGYEYNSTLVNRVEDADITYNVDKRVFDGRWYTPGQVAMYKNGYKDSSMPTTRFVQHNNVMNISSVSLYYELPLRLLRTTPFERVRATLYANDVQTFSSIHIERGTSYPFARSFSFSLTATF
jgi:hypothetical protein